MPIQKVLEGKYRIWVSAAELRWKTPALLTHRSSKNDEAAKKLLKAFEKEI
jgi:hypothetical protein